jgi:chemotaxis protein MotB
MPADDEFKDDLTSATAPAEPEEEETEESPLVHAAMSEEAAETTWLIPYGNMVTVLMIFFLVLYAFSQQKTSTFEKAIQEIQTEIATELENKKEELLRREKETEVAETIENFLEEQNLKDYAQVELSAQRIRISLSNPVLFDLGKAELKPEAAPALGEIAKVLEELPNPVLVEGHTDSLPIVSKRYRSNFELSGARAFAVIEFFIRRGLDPGRFSAFGYGEFRPAADNATEEGRARNRRIEISIVREMEGA